MSEAKFTEGRWSVKGSEIGIVDESDTQSNGMMLTICRVDRFDFCDNWRENANLIACAPEMYAILERMHNGGGLGFGVHAKIEALLAKARGKK
jgi:hypothetical protein